MELYLSPSAYDCGMFTIFYPSLVDARVQVRYWTNRSPGRYGARYGWSAQAPPGSAPTHYNAQNAKARKEQALTPVVVTPASSAGSSPLELALARGHHLIIPASVVEEALRLRMGEGDPRIPAQQFLASWAVAEEAMTVEQTSGGHGTCPE